MPEKIPHYDVIVVGAGIAGIGAAYHLQSKCPGKKITVLEARPDVYVDYHREIVETLNEFFVAIKVLSVDEMACRVSSVCRTREEEERLGREVKKRLNERVGTMMKCSVNVNLVIALR